MRERGSVELLRIRDSVSYLLDADFGEGLVFGLGLSTGLGKAFFTLWEGC